MTNLTLYELIKQKYQEKGRPLKLVLALLVWVSVWRKRKWCKFSM